MRWGNKQHRGKGEKKMEETNVVEELHKKQLGQGDNVVKTLMIY